MSGEDRTLLVDASVLITLARIDSFELLRKMSGQVVVPAVVVGEVDRDPGRSHLREAAGEWVVSRSVIDEIGERENSSVAFETAKAQLAESDEASPSGDVALLTEAIYQRQFVERPVVVVTDDKPLRQTCKAMAIPVSGSIGVLIRSVENGAITREQAEANLVAMDEVGARLSASLLRRAERLIEDAAESD